MRTASQRSPFPAHAAAAAQSARGSAQHGADHPLWHSPRLVAQRAAIAATFGGDHSSSAVVQRVPAGRYITTEDGNLRDVHKAVIVNVKQGSEARVQAGAATETFKLSGLSWPKAHTWTQVLGREGWLKDSVLGTAVPELAPAHDDLALEPLRTTRPTPTPTRSVAIGVSTRGGQTQAEAPATTSIDELNAHQQAQDEALEYPGVAPGARPLGLGKPSAANPADYRVQINGGNLYERTGQHLLTVAKSPFVLSTDGRLYGGQGQTHVLEEQMAKHGDAHVGFPAWAGEMGVANGKVIYIDNESGTFKLRDQANINLIKFLYRRGVLNAQQVPQLDVKRVASWGLDRGGVLGPHHVLDN
ncbi:hypothetical protein LRS03_04205 [Rhizobacter sp. J219]|uniref:hypothetical protein n=1 Tax=Rhizobacter sp. J219 TaxID=2898430 RepID=UPI00215078CC|nr:hypothetical protein [Rhizobacter sp. J219]MCR5882100.1 hypothetical protein [Rhizobacter sp. J219]